MVAFHQFFLLLRFLFCSLSFFHFISSNVFFFTLAFMFFHCFFLFQVSAVPFFVHWYFISFLLFIPWFYHVHIFFCAMFAFFSHIIFLMLYIFCYYFPLHCSCSDPMLSQCTKFFKLKNEKPCKNTKNMCCVARHQVVPRSNCYHSWC